MFNASPQQIYGKRLFDVLAAVSVLVLISPLILLIGLCSVLFLGRPVFFKQKRVGCREREFVLYKFRTMHEIQDRSGKPLPDENRLATYGRLLRTTSLDELPTFFNVLKGDMSLVGPRPLLPEYLPRYSNFQRRRHEVIPGITGWAQINGRNALSWERRFELDVWYVDHWTFWLDIKIMFLTLIKITLREGISQTGHATMPKFLGSPDRNLSK